MPEQAKCHRALDDARMAAMIWMKMTDHDHTAYPSG
jgi:DNA polymerase III epsilon subunit-like protein